MESLSFFWKGATVPEPDRAILVRLHDNVLPVEQRKEALVQLLGSGSVIARGVALDYYSLSQANLRHGNDPMIDAAIDDAARACAVRELAAQPYERAELDAQPRRGANHASALHALWHNAAVEDAPLLARVLAENSEEAVLQEGVKVAHALLYREPVAHAGLVEVLVRLARQRGLDPDIRADAIRAMGSADDEAVLAPIVDAVRDPDLAVSSAAVRSLLERDLARYRPLVEPIVAAWQVGELPPFHVLEVRRLLEEAAADA
jgi:hypothetical protein